MANPNCTIAPTEESAQESNLINKRGPGFTSVEDLMVARAFIAASENSICGAHQKGKAFKATMHAIYVKLVKEQNEADKDLLKQSSVATSEEYIKKGVGVLFSDRTSDSIFNRFKVQIAPEGMKYMGVCETMIKFSLLRTLLVNRLLTSPRLKNRSCPLCFMSCAMLSIYCYNTCKWIVPSLSGQMVARNTTLHLKVAGVTCNKFGTCTVFF